MAIDPEGRLIVACPNYADASQPACLIRIDKQRRVSKWVDVPVLAETGVACPMGIAFGPDGDVFLCDNQGWTGTAKGADKGRILRLRIEHDRVVKTTVVAEGMEHPNGVRIRDGQLYVTQSLMTRVKDAAGLVSAVYRFGLDEEHVKVSNTLADRNLLASFVTRNAFCPYGADGIVFDSKGRLYVGNFGDGVLQRIVLDDKGGVAGNTVFARTDMDTSLDPKLPTFLPRAVRARMRTVDGICADERDNIYLADFSNNAIATVTPAGEVSVLAQNADGDGLDGGLNQPGEPIVWNGLLLATNFDAVTGPDKVNARHDPVATVVALRLSPGRVQ